MALFEEDLGLWGGVVGGGVAGDPGAVALLVFGFYGHLLGGEDA